MTWKQIHRRYLNNDYTYQDARDRALQTGQHADPRYRYRGARIPTPWTSDQPNRPARRHKPRDLEEQLALERVQQALA